MTLANFILNSQDKQEYWRCQSLISDCYERMSTNRDEQYRAKMMALVDKALERMTVLLENALCNSSTPD